MEIDQYRRTDSKPHACNDVSRGELSLDLLFFKAPNIQSTVKSKALLLNWKPFVY